MTKKLHLTLIGIRSIILIEAYASLGGLSEVSGIKN